MALYLSATNSTFTDARVPFRSSFLKTSSSSSSLFLFNAVSNAIIVKDKRRKEAGGRPLRQRPSAAFGLFLLVGLIYIYPPFAILRRLYAAIIRDE